MEGKSISVQAQANFVIVKNYIFQFFLFLNQFIFPFLIHLGDRDMGDMSDLDRVKGPKSEIGGVL